MIFSEGYKGVNALEEAAAFVTSTLTLSNLILNLVLILKKAFEPGYEKNVAKQRTEILMESMKKDGFLTQKRVEEAIKDIPRHLFVPKHFIEKAYEDIPLPTKSYQTISQPRVVVRMTEWLDVKEGNKVLEIGCGSGWQSAIISRLAGDGKIYSIERLDELVEFAKKNHQKAGVKNVEIILGDGTSGIPEKSPFDRIIITASCKKVPQPLLDQLSPDGLLVAPVGEPWQSLTLLRKTSDGIKEEKKEFGYIFAPLIGKFGFKEKNPG
jgi:protein-L-isoaspartate(D-aspartate) O-methyltransferase